MRIIVTSVYMNISCEYRSWWYWDLWPVSLNSISPTCIFWVTWAEGSSEQKWSCPARRPFVRKPFLYWFQSNLVGSIFGEWGLDSSLRKSRGWHLLGPNKGQNGLKLGEFKKIFFSWTGNLNTLIFDTQHP